MKSVAVSTVLALVLVACGGGSAGGSDSTTSTEASIDAGTEPPAADTATTQAAAGEDEPVSSGAEGTGTATVGDMTWDFTLSGNDGREMCDPDAGGIGLFVMVMYGVDGDGQEVALSISSPTADGGAAVTVGDPIMVGDRWVADSEVYGRLANIEGMPEGVGAVAQVNGSTISGTGVFYEDRHLNEVRATGAPYEAGVLDGTFSATCPSD